jgi:hypothetical protein
VISLEYSSEATYLSREIKCSIKPDPVRVTKLFLGFFSLFEWFVVILDYPTHNPTIGLLVVTHPPHAVPTLKRNKNVEVNESTAGEYRKVNSRKIVPLQI